MNGYKHNCRFHQVLLSRPRAEQRVILSSVVRMDSSAPQQLYAPLRLLWAKKAEGLGLEVIEWATFSGFPQMFTPRYRREPFLLVVEMNEARLVFPDARSYWFR